MTALQDWIQRAEKFREELRNKWDGDPRILNPVSALIGEARMLLHKDREQIEEAYKEGAKKRFNTMLIKKDEINKSASDYFTQNYGQ